MPDCLKSLLKPKRVKSWGSVTRTCLSGVQFHPESILSEHGRKMLKNFLELE